MSEPSLKNKVTWHTQVTSEKKPVESHRGSCIANNSQENVHSGHPESISLRLMGTDMLTTDTQLETLAKDFSFHIRSEQFTPSSGFNMGKLTTFAECRDMMQLEPAEVLFVSLPSHGTPEGNRHSHAVLNNIC